MGNPIVNNEIYEFTHFDRNFWIVSDVHFARMHRLIPDYAARV